MDRYRTTLKHDIRFINRSQRHHLMDPKEIEKYKDELPDTMANARWLDQDGAPITDGREERLNSWLNSNREDFYKLRYEDDTPALETMPSMVSEESGES